MYLQDTIKVINIYTMRVPQGEKKKEEEILFKEILALNTLHLKRGIGIRFMKLEESKWINPKKSHQDMF